ncbi:MAG: metallophosphoesterase [Phyllobacteriaceae bacterium]|nr:metallophosphoesterase [Phyllobacteriaceae bacterium]MBA91049.1 metallophosphoesterase [Phyllobacteriaceae bacterium]
MIRILHTADIHLDSPLKSLALRNEALRDVVHAATRDAFARLVDTAIAGDVAAVLIAGDLFDGAERSARTAAFLTGQFDRLRQAGIRAFYIKGNHDAENPVTGELSLPDNVHVFDGRGGKEQLADGVWIHGVSFARAHAPESLLDRFPPPVPGAVNIAMLHTSLAGAEGHDVYAPCSVAELAAMGFDYWALGHVHKRQVHARAPFIVMPGMPQGRDIGEAGPKSATLITIDSHTLDIREIATSVAEFAALEIDVSAIADDDALRALLRARLAALAADTVADAGIVRITLTGTPARHWQILRDRDIWQETAADLARQTGRLWLDKLVLDLSAPAGTATGAAATDELARLMEAIGKEPGFAASVREEVEAVLSELPAHRRNALMPDEAAVDALGERLLANGASRLVARMKGAAG